MNLDQLEDTVLEYFRQNNFTIQEWPVLHPALEWRPRARVSRTLRGQTSDAAVVVREDGSSYKQPHNWSPLVEARRQLPSLCIYFALPEGVREDPLRGELQDLGVGLYLICPDGSLQRVQHDRVPFEDQTISYPIQPGMSYRNRKSVYKVFDNCRDYLWWLDKHFRPYGLALIYDYCSEAGTPPFREVRILGSTLVGESELTRLRREFHDLQSELATHGIQAELRVLDPSVLTTIHDRYIISNQIAFNVLPVGSIRTGQQGSLILDDNPPDFPRLWGLGTTL